MEVNRVSVPQLSSLEKRELREKIFFCSLGNRIVSLRKHWATKPSFTITVRSKEIEIAIIHWSRIRHQLKF